MRSDLEDLLPLFLEEAGSRLERLTGLLRDADGDPGAAVQVRRELHALKGAARLMGLSEVADLCHRAEDCMVGEGGTGLGEVRGIVDRVDAIVDELRGPGAAASDSGEAGTGTSADDNLIRGGSGELRVATEIVDGLAERSARMRVTAKAAGVPIQRLFDLAALIDGSSAGASSSDPVAADLAGALRRTALEIEASAKALQRLSEEQLDWALRLQVRPLGPFLRTLARHTRDLARTLGKEVEVTTAGGEVQLDRRILEAVREAALHLAHNAVDHGIDDGERRRGLGKPEVGRIHFSAEAEGDRVRLVVWDDGCGIDPGAVVRLAVERGLISPAAGTRLTPDEAYQLLHLPGFTTRDLATGVSGRGVGLDAVAASVRTIGGDIWIRSTPDEGTRVTVEVPVTRRGERVLAVRVGDVVLAVPSAAVRSFSRLRPGMIVREGGRLLVRQGRTDVGAVFLATLFGQPKPARATLIETTIAGSVTGLVVDAILGEEEVFVRPLPAVAGAPSVVDGVALLSTGRPAAVLSLQRLSPLDLGSDPDAVDGVGSVEGRFARRILLTDDTPATRKMMRRLLEDAGFRVTAVASAEEALRRIENEPFDCVVTGVELPGLSGVELTRRVRSSDLFADLPVVVVSTRDRPADRLAGLEAGADAYLTKQGLEPGHLAEVILRVTDDATPDVE